MADDDAGRCAAPRPGDRADAAEGRDDGGELPYLYHPRAGSDLEARRHCGDGQCAIAPNARCAEALEELGATVPDFPAYSPDFNPIEQPIGTLKAFLRKFGPRSLRSLTAGVRKGLTLFSPAECAAYFRHAGYGQPKRKEDAPASFPRLPHRRAQLPAALPTRKFRDRPIFSGFDQRCPENTSGGASVTVGTKSARQHTRWLHVASLIVLLLCMGQAANAADDHPLRPIDTSSPRATLQGFIEITDDVYRRVKDVLESYGKSDRLYLSPEERQKQTATLQDALEGIRFLDLSGIAPVLRDTVTVERILQLKEILDRIDIPAFGDIPDREAMARQPSKRWRLPNTEIDIVLIENGPRAGEYLVSAETIDRLPEFYDRVKDLPYKPGAAQQLAEVYRSISHGASATIYDAFLSSPVGLSYMIPPRWMLNLPDWAQARIASVATWQWLGLGLGFSLAGSSSLAPAVSHAAGPTTARTGRVRTGARCWCPSRSFSWPVCSCHGSTSSFGSAETRASSSPTSPLAWSFSARHGWPSSLPSSSARRSWRRNT